MKVEESGSASCIQRECEEEVEVKGLSRKGVFTLTGSRRVNCEGCVSSLRIYYVPTVTANRQQKVESQG